jgi:putative transposase
MFKVASFWTGHAGGTGTLCEGHFRSCLVDAEAYLFACQRYVELKPVRAVVRHPRQYRWSSHRVNAEAKASDLIVPREQYHRLGRSAQARQEASPALFEAARQEVTAEDIRRAANGRLRARPITFRATGDRPPF